jgi:type IV pilus assembly protein PilO
MDTTAFFENIEKIKIQVRIAIFVGTIVLMTAAFLYFSYFPKADEIDKTTQEIAALESKLNQAKARAARLDEFEAQKAEVDAQFAEALKLLPDSKEIPSLLKTISQLGADAGLEVRLFSQGKETSRDFYMEISHSLEVSGPFHNVAVFFDKVGRMERIVNILNVSMKPVKTRSTTLITRCDAVTYYFKGK